MKFWSWYRKRPLSIRVVLLPLMVANIAWWEFRCRWIGWHRWMLVYERDWNYPTEHIYREFQRCRNPDCRAIRLGCYRLVRMRNFEWEQVNNDG